jgi:hypothetical protein
LPVKPRGRDRKLLWTRILSLVLLVVTVGVIRLGTEHQEDLLAYGGTACVGSLFFVLGVRSLYIGSCLKRLPGTSHLYASATPPTTAWAGVLLMPVGALLLIFGRFNMSGVRQDWSALGGIILFVGWGLIWWGTYTIAINDSGLHYVSLFSGCRHVRLDEITSAKVIASLHPTRPTQRIEIYPSEPTKSPIVINRAVFKKNVIDAVLAWLRPKLDRT